MAFGDQAGANRSRFEYRRTTRLLGDQKNTLDLNRLVGNQSSDADRRPAVTPNIGTEDLEKQVGGAIEYFVMRLEVRYCVNHAEDLYDARNAVEITDVVLNRGQHF